ncbi:MAG: universal stress protein [Gemmatimonadales bacterium]
MLEHLMVPLDGSAFAESALPAAATLGAQFGASVTLLHVLEERPPAQVHGVPHLQDVAQAEAYLSEVARWLTDRGVEAAIHVHSPGTAVAKGITDHVSELEADMVILCSHGGKGVRGFISGRVAQQVLFSRKVPVLVMPTLPQPRSRTFSVQNVLVPLSGDASAEAALDAAAELVTGGGEITLARVVPTVETASGMSGAATRLLPKAAEALLDTEVSEAMEYLRRLGTRLKSAVTPVRTVVLRGDPARELAALASEGSVDLIVLATHGRKGVSAMWAGSVGARLVGRLDVPVLLIRLEREIET